MARSTITSKGRITLPGAIRRHLGVATGDRLDFIIAEDGRVEIRPVSGSVRRLFGSLRQREARRVDVRAMDRAMQDHLSREDVRVRRRSR